MNVIKGIITTVDVRIAVVVTRFNWLVSNNLLEGSIDILKNVGHIKDENITIVWAPGHYELPLVVNVLSNTRRYDAIIVLSSMIRSDVSNFEYIIKECSSNLLSISLDYLLPISYGVLVSDDVNQAIEKSNIKHNNKGAEIAMISLEMISILKKINCK